MTRWLVTGPNVLFGVGLATYLLDLLSPRSARDE